MSSFKVKIQENFEADRRRLNILPLFMSLKLRIGPLSNRENSLITEQLLTKLMCFIEKGLLYNSTEGMVNQNTGTEKYSEYFRMF